MPRTQAPGPFRRDVDRLEVATRRRVLAGGAAGLLMVSAGGSRATATPMPQVDALTLQVVTDAATFGPFLENLNLPGLRVVRAGNGGPQAPRMSPHPLLGEFGLSIHAESTRGAETRRVLVDFGYSREVLANNMGLLGLNPNHLNAAVLSHGHLDHYGGYAGLFGADAGPGHRLPLTVGGEETFCERVAMIGDPPPLMGALDREALARAGFAVRIEPGPVIVGEHAFTTGVIPLESFERAAVPTAMRPGIGCERALLDPAKRDLTQLPDDAQHELATCYNVRGLGLVVIASCSHRGVINSVRRAQAVSGVTKVHAVIGGFHLVRPRTEEEARRTVAEFSRIDPTYVIPMHCTGEPFIAEALRVMPQKVVRPYVGTQFVFAPTA
jgi:7,8-dihydropterin-6-yl-methyl-4-(beta-D-ribofuranosyl)aminobenzene 5'-phosphate synthase